MGCGVAYLNNYTVGAGSQPMPYWFGPRPDPTRPAPLQQRFLFAAAEQPNQPQSQQDPAQQMRGWQMQRLYPNYAYEQAPASTAPTPFVTQFRAYHRPQNYYAASPPYAFVRPEQAHEEDWTITCSDWRPQGWRAGNVLAARAYPYPVRAVRGCGSCASL